jgi:hypothetical protein
VTVKVLLCHGLLRVITVFMGCDVLCVADYSAAFRFLVHKLIRSYLARFAASASNVKLVVKRDKRAVLKRLKFATA